MSYFVFIFLLEVKNQRNYMLQELHYPSKNCYTETFLSSSLFVFDIHICCLKLAGCVRCIWIVKVESCCGRQPVKSEPGTRGILFPAVYKHHRYKQASPGTSQQGRYYEPSPGPAYVPKLPLISRGAAFHPAL